VGPLGLHDLKLLQEHGGAHREQLVRESNRIGAPGLPALSEGLLAWASGEQAEPPFTAAADLLFMDRYALFTLQLEKRRPSELLRSWWRIHRQGSRWGEGAPKSPRLAAVASALALAPALALRPGVRQALLKRLTDTARIDAEKGPEDPGKALRKGAQEAMELMAGVRT
jgi:hypothetical protein